MLAAAADIVVVLVTVATVTVAIVIVPIAVVALVFELRCPLVLLSRQLVVASCIAYVPGIFAARPSLG